MHMHILGQKAMTVFIRSLHTHKFFSKNLNQSTILDFGLTLIRRTVSMPRMSIKQLVTTALSISRAVRTDGNSG